VRKKPKSKRSFDPDHPALKRGADDLMDLAEHHHAKRPRTLRRLRLAYVRLCLRLYNSLRYRFGKTGGAK
jgi:hypothetical protein